MNEGEDDLLKELTQAGDAASGEAGFEAESVDLVEVMRHGLENGREQGNGQGTAPPVDSPGEHGHPAFGPDPGGADATLGGYIAVHDRPPAFEGKDGQPYSVGVDVEETGDPERPYAAFLLFLRWAASGAGIMGHVESDDVAFGATAAEARQAALDLSLFEVRAELDAAIARREEMEA
jgi:hypothetical protein